MGCGTQTAALKMGGNPTSDSVEEYNGTSWTAGTALPVARIGAAAAGLQTAALLFAGSIPPSATRTNTSINYDGSSWTATPSMGTASNFLAGAGSNTAALAIGGYNPPSGSNRTEEFTVAGATKTFTTS